MEPQPTMDASPLHSLLSVPLREVPFVVFDLETTGGTPEGSEITEIGAVRLRGGEVTGELATLVRPDFPVPAEITTLTGITNEMVAEAPRINEVLPSFLEFARGCVLVAHNAPFDLGFLHSACASLDYRASDDPAVDTAALARLLLTRQEVRNHKLATLAKLFPGDDPPCHRALADARATVHVLHGLFERLGGYAVETLGELARFLGGSTAGNVSRTR